jgi:hypothetical protein
MLPMSGSTRAGSVHFRSRIHGHSRVVRGLMGESAMDRAYYSQRIGRGPLADPTIEDLARALTLTVDEMWKRGYMQEWHGFTCADAGDIDGRAAMSLEGHIEAETGWRSAWPLPEPLIDPPDEVRISHDDRARLRQSAEDKLFDLSEYFHGHVSQGIEDHQRSSFHSYSNCGWHYGAFDRRSASPGRIPAAHEPHPDELPRRIPGQRERRGGAHRR